MTAHDEKTYLPKEPIDLPRPELDLPMEPKEIPAHAVHGRRDEEDREEVNDHRYDVEVKTVLAWHAPGRPFKKHGREFYFNSLLISLAVEIIIFLFHDYSLMAVVAALTFLSFALSLVPPRDFYYKITTEGIQIEDHFFLWQELYDFYEKKQHGNDTFILRTEAYYPGELLLMVGDVHREQIKQALLQFLPFREFVKPTFADKSGDWLARTFPLDRESSHK